MNRTAYALLVALALPAGARAQYVPDDHARDLARDRRELREDRRATEDDWRDLQHMKHLLARYDEARAHRDREELARVEERVSFALAREQREAQVETSRDLADASRERREARQDWVEGRPGEAAHDRHEARQDRREAAGDVARANRISQIRREFESLRGRTERRPLDRKRALISEVVRMARAEVRRDIHEARSDGRELRRDERF